MLKYREALWKDYATIQQSNQLNKYSIISVFQTVKDSNQGIRSPQSQIIIKKGQSELTPGEVIYTPPRGEGIIEEKLTIYCHF